MCNSVVEGVEGKSKSKIHQLYVMNAKKKKLTVPRSVSPRRKRTGSVTKVTQKRIDAAKLLAA